MEVTPQFAPYLDVQYDVRPWLEMSTTPEPKIDTKLLLVTNGICRRVQDYLGNPVGQTTFFQRLSSHWKKQYTGWTAWILSPDMKLPSAMRLKESRRVVMFNGPIECRLFRFDLVAGSNKPRAGDAAET